MRQLQAGLDSVLHHVTSGGAAAPPATAEPAARERPLRAPALKQRKAPDAQPAGAVIPGLEPSVVTAARAAGISDAQLRRMGALAGQPTALNDGKTKRRSGPLSESEESEGGEEALQGGEGQTPSDAVGKAVVQMSKILAKMHASKKSELDELLTEGAGLEGGLPSTTGGKSKAAAYLKLCKTPQVLIDSFEQLLSEDFLSIQAAPGAQASQASARSWLEHRSHLPAMPGPVRWSWQVAGALDCLRSGRPLEAQARLGLLLAASDQAAIENGSWLLASEMLLEPQPPVAAFAKHKAPEAWEARQTKLLDPRIFAVLIHRIREREAFLEARKKLTGHHQSAGDPPGASGHGQQDDDSKPPRRPVRNSGKGAKGEAKGESK